MTSLESILPRLGATSLTRLLGPSVVGLLELLDERQVSPTKLAELLIRESGEEWLLLNKNSREEIINALPKKLALELASLLGVEVNKPWESINGLMFKIGQIRTETLFNYFGLAAPIKVEVDSTPTVLLKADYPLFPHQQLAARRALRYLNAEKKNRVLLHMPTGSGKTRTAMNLLAYFLRYRCEPNELVVWLAYSEELCDQASEEVKKAWGPLGDRNLMLHRHYGIYRSNLESLEGGVLVAGLGLLYQDSLRKQSAFLENARRTLLVVFDEAHQATAPTYKHLLNLLASDNLTSVLGLSATPGRAWIDARQDLELADYFFRQKVTLQVKGYDDPIAYLQNEGYLAQTEYIPLDIPKKDVDLTPTELQAIRLGLDLPETVLKRLGTDSARNLLIVDRIIKEWTPGKKALVFACSVEHARLLAAVLRLKGCPAACVTGNTPTNIRQRTIDRYRSSNEVDILTNYGVLTTGFDAPKTSIAIIARPTRSVVLYSQMMGRAARGPKAGGNKQCRIITVVDSIPGFRNITEGFSHWDDIWPTNKGGK